VAVEMFTNGEFFRKELSHQGYYLNKILWSGSTGEMHKLSKLIRNHNEKISTNMN